MPRSIVGDVDKVAAFLKQDKKLVNARDSDGRTPLHWAAMYGQTKVMEVASGCESRCEFVGCGRIHALALGGHIQQERTR